MPAIINRYLKIQALFDVALVCLNLLIFALATDLYSASLDLVGFILIPVLTLLQLVIMFKAVLNIVALITFRFTKNKTIKYSDFVIAALLFAFIVIIFDTLIGQNFRVGLYLAMAMMAFVITPVVVYRFIKSTQHSLDDMSRHKLQKYLLFTSLSGLTPMVFILSSFSYKAGEVFLFQNFYSLALLCTIVPSLVSLWLGTRYFKQPKGGTV